MSQRHLDGLHGRVSVVTGGGSGIGRAAVMALAARGASVMIVGRTAQQMQDLVERYENVECLVANVTLPDDATRIVETVMDRWGRLDVLVNNAGAFRGATLAEANAELVAELLTTNVVGPTLLARAALDGLRAARGAIVNISSTYGHKPGVGRGHYGASKAALESLTQTWALELAPEGIRVNAVAPGPTDTPMLARAGLAVDVIESVVADSVRLVPLGRRGAPEEVAPWIVALADPSASWVTGSIMHVDGGLSLA